MARKDVNLVIRAKDETTKAFNAIGRASEALVAGFADIAKDGKDAQSTLGMLGKALGDLDRTFKGFSGAEALSTNLKDAGEALSRLKTESADAANRLAGLDRDLDASAAATDRLAKKAKGAATALSEQGAAVSRAKADAAGYEASVRQTAAELGKLETRQRNLPGQIDKASTALDRATARYDRYAAKVAASSKPSATLVGLLEKSGQSVIKNTERLTGLTVRLNDTNSAIDSTTATLRQQAAAFASSTNEVARQEAVYDKIKANAAELAVNVRAAANAQGVISAQFQKAASAANNAESAVRKAAVEFDQIAVATGKAELALEQFTAGAGSTLTRAVRQQGAALAESRRELEAQEVVIRDYAAALAATDQPTERMIRNLTEARAAGRQMRAEIAVQETAYASMSATLKATAQDYDSIIAAQSRFQAIRGAAGAQVTGIRGASGIASDLEANREAATRSAAALAEAKVAADALSGSFARIGPPTREQAAAMDAARAAVRLHREELNANGTAAAQLATIYQRARAGTITFAQAERQAQTVSSTLAAALARVRAEAGNLAGASTRAAAGMRQVGSAADDANRKITTLGDAFRRLFGIQRESLSLAGRIRGQIVQMTAAYVGLFGVIGGIQQVVTATQTLEAATSRLNVVFNQDQGRVSQELDFLRRTSDRLKISFGLLSNEYTKFAVATKGTNISSEQTRQIFTSVSEAARVYKLDQEQVNGVFVALTQIASKGKIQLEELSGQLGDRLPGAIQILADGMGITTEELLAMTQAGEVTSASLVNFADQLSKNVAPQLEDALTTSRAEFDAFIANVFNGFLRLGQGGFMDAITRLVREINEQLTSAEFLSFIDRLSVILGTVADVLTALASNVRLVAGVLTGLFAVKIAQWATGAAFAFRDWAKGLKESATSADVATAATTRNVTATTTLGRAAQTATGAVRTLGLSLKALGTATLVGAAFTAASVALSFFLTSSSEAVEVMEASRDAIAKVKDAADKSGGSIDKLRAALDGLSESQLRQTLREAEAQLKAVREGADDVVLSFTKMAARRSAYTPFIRVDGAAEQFEAIEALNEEFANGERNAESYKEALDEIAKSAVSEAIADYAVMQQEAADKGSEWEGIVKDVNNSLTVVTGTTDEAKDALDELNGVTEETAEAMGVRAAVAAEKFQNALNKVKEFIPGLKAELDDLADMKDLQLAIDGLGMGPYTRDQQALIDRASGEVAIGGSFEKTADAVVKAADGIEASAVLLRKMEGFISSPAWDVNADRVGFGSDTITLDDGTVRRVTKGMRVSVADANRDLYRRIGEFQSTVRKQIGSERFESFNAPQQAALTSVAYNYGSLPKSLVNAIATGSEAAISAAIARLGSDNAGINKTRRQREAGLFTRGANPTEGDVESQIEAETQAREKQAEEDARRNERAAEYNELKEQRITQLENEAAGEGRLTLEQTIQKAIQDERNKARKADTDLGEEDIARITAATTAEYNREAAVRATKEQKDALAAAEAELTALETQRTELLAQQKLYSESGDTAKVEETKLAVTDLNAKILEAIASITTLYQTMGGPGADAAIAKMGTMSLEIAKQSEGAKSSFLDWKQVGDLFGNGLANAFDSFAQAVAEGKDIGEAAREAFLKFASDFLRQIAQMIIQKAIFNALNSAFPGMGFGGVGVSHAGGMAGGSNRTRRVSPMLFANAPRYHTGGIAGLKPNEMPAILERGEEILAKDSPRNIMNGGGGGGAGQGPAMPANLKVVNTFDAGSFMSEALSSKEGQQVMLNFVNANKGKFKGALG